MALTSVGSVHKGSTVQPLSVPPLRRVLPFAAAAMSLGVAAGALVIAAPAHAAAASAIVADNRLVYRAAPGQVNNLTIDWAAPGKYRVKDSVPITAGPGCAAQPGSATEVLCTVPSRFDVDVDDLNDTVLVSGQPQGFSWIQGGAGNDVIKGGEGRDFLDGGPGGDAISGGSGDYDVVSYADRTNIVVADLDGQAGDDGETGEGDSLAIDIEHLDGGGAADILVGNSLANTIFGGAGNDIINGAGGGDFIDGQAGDDHIFGGSGDDPELNGGTGNDVIKGEAGNDGIVPAEGDDRGEGGPGDDSLVSSPGADTMLGGPGRDNASYRFHGAAIIADLDGQSGDDGAPSEGDTLGADIEDLTGTDYNDALTGNDSANMIDGVGGADMVLGLGGRDEIDASGFVSGGDGNDTIQGAQRADTLKGDSGDDVLRGGAGDDYLDGGPDHDKCHPEADGGSVRACE